LSISIGRSADPQIRQGRFILEIGERPAFGPAKTAAMSLRSVGWFSSTGSEQSPLPSITVARRSQCVNMASPVTTLTLTGITPRSSSEAFARSSWHPLGVGPGPL